MQFTSVFLDIEKSADFRGIFFESFLKIQIFFGFSLGKV